MLTSLKVKVFKVSINRYLIKNKNTNYFIKKNKAAYYKNLLPYQKWNLILFQYHDYDINSF